MDPPEKDAPSLGKRFQFRLSYLIYLLTLLAIGFVLLRHVFDVQAGWVFNTVMSAWVAALIAYFAFRLPILLRRLTKANRQLRTTRAELANFAANVGQTSDQGGGENSEAPLNNELRL